MPEQPMSKEDFGNFVNGILGEHKPFASCLYEIFRDRNGDIIATKPLTLNVKENFGTSAIIASFAGKKIEEFIGGKECIIHTFTKEEIVEILNVHFAEFANDTPASKHPNICVFKYANANAGVEIGGIICPNTDCLHEDTTSIEEIHFRFGLARNNKYHPQLINLDLAEHMPLCVYFEDRALSKDVWEISSYRGELIPICINRLPPKEWHLIN